MTAESNGNTSTSAFSFTKKLNNSVAPAVIDINSLNEALTNPPSANGNSSFIVNGNSNHLSSTSPVVRPPKPPESRATTPSFGRREPGEISFLSGLGELRVSHNQKDECLSFPSCQEIVEFNSSINDNSEGEGSVILRAVKRICVCSCTHENFEIFHTFTGELVILVEIEGGNGCFCVIPTSIQIYGPPGRSLGYVDRHSSGIFNIWYEIRNTSGELMYKSEPKFSLMGPNEYPIVSNSDSKNKVAEIIETTGLCGTSLNVTFFQDIPPSKRALIIGMALLVDIQRKRRTAN